MPDISDVLKHIEQARELLARLPKRTAKEHADNVETMKQAELLAQELEDRVYIKI